ncbi:hypothetical protein VE03_03330 [Pseudogymnoascus sp. 23342-1-I1]|nr:hypothetical protein VE03_03330 [Pseudogymnoascus sp. 23342-1-I1]
MSCTSITVIFSPYHVGIRDHRVGNGPNRIMSLGVVSQLESLGVPVKVVEILHVDQFEGEIGRSFEVLRRISTAVSTARASQSFPLILAGNCMSSAAVVAGLGIRDLGFVYFDAHDDLDSPDVNENGYFDAMGLSMLRGESWKTLMNSVPGYRPMELRDKFVYCGLRDLSEVQRQRVKDVGMDVIWGDATKKVDFKAALEAALERKNFSPALVHLDLDVLDESLGNVNDYPSPGGMYEEELVVCLGLVPKKATPASLTVCSFDPDTGDGDKIAKIGIRAITTFLKGMQETGALSRSN